jgi:hypothetical protein
MKKALFIIAMCLALHAHAQLKKGNVQLGGSMGWSTYKNETTNTGNFQSTKNSGLSFYFQPGIFVTDKSVLGLGLGYSNNRYDNSSSNSTFNLNHRDKQTQNGYSVGPYYKWYKSLSERIAFSILASVNYSFNNSTYYNANGTDFTDSKTSSHGLNANVSPGIIYFINTRWGLTTSFGSLHYSTMKYKPNSSSNANTTTTSRTSNAGVDLSLSSFSFGLQYFIAR